MQPKGYTQLLEAINEGSETVAVIGLGYVGLPLAILLARSTNVIGIDSDPDKIAELAAGRSTLKSVSSRSLQAAARPGRFTATTDYAGLAECDVVVICVPTPLDAVNKPDLSHLEDACNNVARYVKKPSLVCLESTTYPGCTETFVKPILEAGLGEHGENFWLCFAPERISPTVHSQTAEDIPKVIGGLGRPATALANQFYAKHIRSLHLVSSPQVAEMVKILENSYRLVNISLVNELSLLCGKLDIDIWEVIQAAKTKPFGFEAFLPGPGIGGHCIPLDPYYLDYLARHNNFELKLINAAGQINALMPHRMVVKINSALNSQNKSISGSRVLFLGVTYKADVDDTRESPILKIIGELVKKGAEVSFHDPYVDDVTVEGRQYSGIKWEDLDLGAFDCVVIAVNHAVFGIPNIVKEASLVVDLRNATAGIDDGDGKVFKL